MCLTGIRAEAKVRFLRRTGLRRLAQLAARLTDKAPTRTHHQTKPLRTAPPPSTRPSLTPIILRRHPHARQTSQVVTPPMLKRMLRRVSRSSFPARDRAMILLSVKAGLRACEIAGLDWSMVLDAQGACLARPTSAT